MSKPQFITAMRRCFGDEILDSENSFSKLFDSFDFDRRGQVDWRALLYMLLILLQAGMGYAEQLRWAFCLYASAGMLDTTTPGSLSLGTIKNFMCVPVVPGEHRSVRDAVDECWLELAGKDPDARLLNNACDTPGVPGGADDVQMSYALFKKLLRETEFAALCQTHDRPWTYVFEEEYFHPILCAYLRDLRKQFRDARECARFLRTKNYRMQKYTLFSWKSFVQRRNDVRWRFTVWYMRWRMSFLNRAFEKWKKQALEDRFGMNLQKGARGFLGRSRRRLMESLTRKATTVQAVTRMAQLKQSYQRTRQRVNWAATMVQKVWRGHKARVRVTSLLEGYLETAARRLAQDRVRWALWRKSRAATRIAMCYRKHRVRRNVAYREATRQRVDDLARSMEAMNLQARIKREVYRQNLARFYTERKEAYDNTIATEKTTMAERSRVMAKRRREIDAGKRAAQERLKEEQEEREQQIRFQAFSMKWYAGFCRPLSAARRFT